MSDFEIQRCSRRCADSGRELGPGETFYSALVADGASVQRRDYAEEAWKGPPPDAIGWWKSRIPDPDARKVNWAPNDVILHYFTQLEGNPAAADTRYVLTLLMIRRRVVRLEETERDDQGREVMVVYCPRNETEYRVSVRPPTTERRVEIQEELTRLLFASAA